jgi:hypothetical protein
MSALVTKSMSKQEELVFYLGRGGGGGGGPMCRQR